MRDPMNRVEPIGRPYERGRFEDELHDDDEAQAAPEPEARQSFRARVGQQLRVVWSVLALAFGTAGTGYVGGQVLNHSRAVQDALPGHLDLLDYFFAGFLVLAGLFIGLAVAGMYVRRAWGFVALGVLTMLLGMSLLFASAMREQFDAFSDLTGQRCVPVTIGSGALASSGPATLCSPAGGGATASGKGGDGAVAKPAGKAAGGGAAAGRPALRG